MGETVCKRCHGQLFHTDVYPTGRMLRVRCDKCNAEYYWDAQLGRLIEYYENEWPTFVLPETNTLKEDRACECGHAKLDHVPDKSIHANDVRCACGCIKYRPYRIFKKGDPVFVWDHLGDHGFRPGTIVLYGADSRSWGVHFLGDREDQTALIFEDNMILQTQNRGQLNDVQEEWAAIHAVEQHVRDLKDKLEDRVQETITQVNAGDYPKEILDALADVLAQACGDDKDNTLDSMGLSAYELGIEILVKYGRADLVPAGRLIAKFKQPGA